MSKFVLMGRAADGRSTIVSAAPIGDTRAVTLIDGVSLTDEMPVPSDVSIAQYVDVMKFGFSCGEGTAAWGLFAQSPGEEFEVHYTDTIDFDLLIEGSSTLITETDELEMGPGDCLLVQGLAHGWRAGSEGCRIINVLVGVARQAR